MGAKPVPTLNVAENQRLAEDCQQIRHELLGHFFEARLDHRGEPAQL